MKSIDLLEQWLEEADIDPVLHKWIVEYARGRGQRTVGHDGHMQRDGLLMY
jgi:hypothetical protein